MLQQNKKFVLGVINLLLIFNILAWFVVYDLNENSFLEVIFFDVGQGDAIFIETPQKHQILIDGGPTPVILEKLNKEMPFWDRTIDLIILTHPESDHLAGLIEVLKSYKVRNILWTGVIRDTGIFRKWQELLAEENAKIYIAQSGQKIIVNQTTVLEILHPFENLEGKSVEDANNTSIVLRLGLEGISFLFTGDVYKSAERELLSKALQLNADVLKIGHHGSKTSTGEEFIIAVSPEMAVISVGRDNKFGHPHPETLEILEKYDIKIFRTDLNGDIKIISDGENIKVK